MDESADIRAVLPEVEPTSEVVDGYATTKWAGEVLLREANDVQRRDRGAVRRPTGVQLGRGPHDDRPQVLGVLRPAEQLEAVLPGVAGARQHDRVPGRRRPHRRVVAQVSELSNILDQVQPPDK